MEVSRPSNQGRAARRRRGGTAWFRAPSGSPDPTAMPGRRSRRSGRLGSTRTAVVSMPRSAIEPSMKRPRASSPATLAIATLSPSRAVAAGEDHRRAAHHQVHGVHVALRLAEDGVGLGSRRARSRPRGSRRLRERRCRACVQYSRYQPSPGAEASASVPRDRACQGRPSASTRSTSRFSRERPSDVSQASRSRAGIVAAGAQTDRPASTPEAPARQAMVTWRSNVRSSTPPERRTHGHGRSAVELGAGVRPGRLVGDRGVVRELGLEDVSATRHQASRGLDHAAPAGLAGELPAAHRIERERLDEERQIARPALRRNGRRAASPGRRRWPRRGGSR